VDGSIKMTDYWNRESVRSGGRNETVFRSDHLSKKNVRDEGMHAEARHRLRT
jgi:hypothetical protein